MIRLLNFLELKRGEERGFFPILWNEGDKGGGVYIIAVEEI